MAPPPLTGGRVLPLPPEPLPERDGQQPAEGLLPRRAVPELHAAAAAGPGERGAGFQLLSHDDALHFKFRFSTFFFSSNYVQEPMLLSPIPRRSVSRELVSRMQLEFDEEDDGGQEMEAVAAHPQTSRGAEVRRSGAAMAAAAPGLPDASWGSGELLCVSLWIFFQPQPTPAGKVKQGRVCSVPWGQLDTLIVHP